MYVEHMYVAPLHQAGSWIETPPIQFKIHKISYPISTKPENS